MDDVRDQVDVALPATPAGVRAERLLHGEAQEEQLDVVDVELVRGLPLARTLLEVSVVPEEKGANADTEASSLVTTSWEGRGRSAAPSLTAAKVTQMDIEE